MRYMPWFRFVDDARVTIPFRNGKCELGFAVLGGDKSWGWIASRERDPNRNVVLVRAANVADLHGLMRIDGFEVPVNSPAEKVMRAAVKCGYAEELPDDAGSRDEFLRARMAAKRAAAHHSSQRNS